ncbi:MAG: hypothetical protein QOD06_3411 [Candidatus Binatota bacterium]|jgi:hypothetical protein|nr:hypothetical protein [Candidatus Binatota bacterium]
MAESRSVVSEESPAPAGFQPDTVLPSQFFESLRQKPYVQGEKRLIAAVLADAVDCYMKQLDSVDPAARQAFGEAEQWIFQEFPGWFFSFSSVCDMLGLNPAYVRRGLVEWRARRLASFRPNGACVPRALEVEPPLLGRSSAVRSFETPAFSRLPRTARSVR